VVFAQLPLHLLKTFPPKGSPADASQAPLTRLITDSRAISRKTRTHGATDAKWRTALGMELPAIFQPRIK
jgi:hypothetical protein